MVDNMDGHNSKPVIESTRLARLKIILGLLDLTTLEGTDHDQRVKELCEKAIAIKKVSGISPAAICVYPVFVRTAKRSLGESGIAVASVAGAFPSGQSPLSIRVAEVEYAVNEGADEIDMVISRGRFLSGDFDFISEEVAAIKKACNKAHLKVILETGELITPENIRKASELAVLAGADFIKTSTGKVQPAATLEAMSVMLEVIKEHHQASGKLIGIKPAGGISTPDQALQYFDLVETKLGAEWLKPALFRIGASRLADGILAELNVQL
ncbi:MAG: deoxyribose-phosphate aldolase [Bacteroidales bacterium]|nr:deoxyribose-phosphate aldolase [Bacteroidales bacterium]